MWINGERVMLVGAVHDLATPSVYPPPASATEVVPPDGAQTFIRLTDDVPIFSDEVAQDVADTLSTGQKYVSLDALSDQRQ